jgi:hypothetical protein
LKSKEKEKGSNNLESSLSGTKTEAGMEAETAFSFIGTVFSVWRTGLYFSVGGGDHCF